MNRLKLSLVIFTSALLTVGCHKVEKDALQIPSAVPTPTFASTVDNYAIEVFGNEYPPYCRVMRNGQTVFEHSWKASTSKPGEFRIAKLANSGQLFMFVENIVSGNRYSYDIYRCSSPFKKVLSIENGYERLRLEGPDQGGWHRIVAYDWFDMDSGARALAPEVVLVWQDESFVLDEASMRATRPDEETICEEERLILEKARSASKSSTTNWPPIKLEVLLVNMIYAGEEARAQQILQRCWPDDVSEQKAYWSGLNERLERSRYWPEIDKLNRTSKARSS